MWENSIKYGKYLFFMEFCYTDMFIFYELLPDFSDSI